MKLIAYQEKSRETAIYPNVGNNIIYPTLGLVGEAGEIANKIKKILRDDNGILTPIVKSTLIDEIGDVVSTVAQICRQTRTTFVLTAPFTNSSVVSIIPSDQ